MDSSRGIMFLTLNYVYSTLVLMWCVCGAMAQVEITDLDFSGTQQREGPECDLPMDKGSCSETFPRYYYDRTSGNCKPFNYTGCGGNFNNFYTLSDCNERCICSQRKDTGSCNAPVARYYYNTATNLCQLFVYNGCAGNVNNFPDESACNDVCKSKTGMRRRCLRRPEFGSCSRFITRYYYDVNCGCCQQFTYGGCEGNGNNFESEEICLKKCEGVKPSKGRSVGPRSRTSTVTPAVSTPSTTPAGGSGGRRAIIIQTNPAPGPDNLNNIIQNLIGMIGG